MNIGKMCAVIINEDIELDEELKERAREYFEDLIVFHGVWGFYFGHISKASRICLEILEKIRKDKYAHIYFMLCPCVGEADAIESIRFQYIDQCQYLDRSKNCAFNRDIHMIIHSDVYFIYCKDENNLREKGKYVFSEDQLNNVVNLAKRY